MRSRPKQGTYSYNTYYFIIYSLYTVRSRSCNKCIHCVKPFRSKLSHLFIAIALPHTLTQHALTLLLEAYCTVCLRYKKYIAFISNGYGAASSTSVLAKAIAFIMGHYFIMIYSNVILLHECSRN